MERQGFLDQKSITTWQEMVAVQASTNDSGHDSPSHIKKKPKCIDGSPVLVNEGWCSRVSDCRSHKVLGTPNVTMSVGQRLHTFLEEGTEEQLEIESPPVEHFQHFSSIIQQRHCDR